MVFNSLLFKQTRVKQIIGDRDMMKAQAFQEKYQVLIFFPGAPKIDGHNPTMGKEQKNGHINTWTTAIPRFS